jgi:hypothetical protein
MKAIGTLSAKNLLTAIAAGLVLSAFSSASAADVPSRIQAWPAQGAFEHCGCDTKQGVEMYVQNLINDSQQRGLSCEIQCTFLLAFLHTARPAPVIPVLWKAA